MMDVSSDEDDPYANFAGRLKALKEKRFKTEEPSVEIGNFSINIEQQRDDEKTNDKEINGKETYDNDDTQTQKRMVRSRRNKGITTRATARHTRRRHLPVNDLEYDVDIISFEENQLPESIPETYNNDVIALSDDEISTKDDNYEITIKVFWRSNRIDRLNMRRHDNFQGIFQYYADLEKVSMNEILIMKKDKIINHTDTPASLKLSVIDILDGGIVHPGMNTSKELLKGKNNDDDNVCTIKVQTANKKQSLIISLKRDQQFKALFANCARQIGVKESSLKFYFDGEQISPTDTPELLDLEEEACIDLHIST
ncbi:uncharacterized protein CG4449 isoform X1 [Camponotus floridanus]|uniref:uncharacterized protein CG4449 isoform X1 n=1 Tax=Camponotus floridanus TaxID=104421 RepID=UPI00059D5F36|nr:uncharacterized protein CG4449 isoform X1 [Camponotus floridanus]XP_011263891.1 uncharacterized protein CG4449 isoform X1 [Camponotus floridanus]XP_011263892.1 uncharacterized protein CG4449 isoform X1 [Camponotus floridanus]